jgi:glycosyltransferase involved in cell wall biosynthesis
MSALKNKNLLLISPHFQTFVRTQALFAKPFLNDVCIVIPLPYFSKLTLKLPYISRYFKFLKITSEANEISTQCKLLFSNFFTLPIKPVRQRNPYLSAKSCAKTISKNSVKFDIIHTHFIENGFIGSHLKDLHNVPLVITAHGGDVYDAPFRDSWGNNFARYVLAKADRIITVSQYNSKILLSLGVSARKLVIIPNGYDGSIFKPKPSIYARTILGLPINKKVLLSVGNLVKIKGHFDLINAMKIVCSKRSDVILVIIGNGFLKEKLRNRSIELQLDEKVFLVGGKKHEEINLWMNAADLLVLPSFHEGFPTVIPEALACGLPVVGTNVGGIPEALSVDFVGAVVSPHDPKHLADKILEMLDQNYSRQDIVNHAKQYEQVNVNKRLVSIYSSLV